MLYLDAKSSLALLRFLRSTSGKSGVEFTQLGRRSFANAANTVKALLELDATAQLWLTHIDAPIGAYVPDKRLCTKTDELYAHIMPENLPSDSFLSLGHGICICSPQLIFYLEAWQLDTLDAIRLAMELCGSYSKWRLPLFGPDHPYYTPPTEKRSYTYDVPPVLTVKQAINYIHRLGSRRGVRVALDVLKHVADSSASPMETAVYLLLCLPKRLGGHGFPQAILNPRVTVIGAYGSTDRFPDIYFKSACVDVEYNSDEAHSGEWARYRDSRRAVELVTSRIHVLPLTRRQLMDAAEFEAFAQGLRRLLGIRSRSNSPAWIQRHAQLRHELLNVWQ